MLLDKGVRMVAAHSCVLSPHLKADLTAAAASDGPSKYSRLFPDLPRLDADEATLLGLGRSGSALDDALTPDEEGRATDDATTPAAWPFFGQFIAHDITADRSLLAHHARLGELRNFRRPALDLECVYGLGPGGTPYLFDVYDPDMFLLGTNDAGLPNDIPRNLQGVGLVGDKRNDSQMIISQLHLLFLKFHNAAVADVRARGVDDGAVFAEAQRLARWHHQWLTVHEYLPLCVGDDTVRDILDNGRRHFMNRPGDAPTIPVEFADAAFRFGHSQIRARYRLNDGATDTIFPGCIGGCPVPQVRAIDWRWFFAADDAHPPQPAKKIDTKVVHPLVDLPEAITGHVDVPEHASLAVRDLQRSHALDLPSGEEIARAMGETPLTPEQVGLASGGWAGETPLWYYVLKEAEVLEGGERLGPVGGRIVAEVLIGLIAADPTSYLGCAPDWTPVFPAAQPDTFTMRDLLRFAGAV